MVELKKSSFALPRAKALQQKNIIFLQSHENSIFEPLLLQILDLINDRDDDWSVTSCIKEDASDVFLDLVF